MPTKRKSSQSYGKRKVAFKEQSVRRYGRWCFIRGHLIEDGELITVDHVVPLIADGLDEESNWQTACEPCNKWKSGRAMKPVPRIWYLDEADLPEELHLLRSVFLGPPALQRPPRPVSDRQRNETLHDYLTRKGIKCSCRACRVAAKAAAEANNATLV